jgi:hypothetical protein
MYRWGKGATALLLIVCAGHALAADWRWLSAMGQAILMYAAFAAVLYIPLVLEERKAKKERHHDGR